MRCPLNGRASQPRPSFGLVVFLHFLFKRHSPVTTPVFNVILVLEAIAGQDVPAFMEKRYGRNELTLSQRQPFIRTRFAM
jgi:hypothetical protein